MMIKTKQKCYICKQNGYHERIEECLDAALARANTAEAEVERLTAELQNTTVDRDMALSYADVLKNERDALRAQLDAGGKGWLNIDTAPSHEIIELKVLSHIWRDGGAAYHGDDNNFMGRIRPEWQWRPAPPKD